MLRGPGRRSSSTSRRVRRTLVPDGRKLTPMAGIVSYGAYVPYWRLQRSAIGASARRRGRRRATQRGQLRRGHDVDGRRGGPARARRRARRVRAGPAGLRHHRPGLPRQDQRHRDPRRARPPRRRRRPSTSSAPVRSGVGAAWMAQAAGGLAVLSDVRTGRPGSADEAGGGDAAVALAFGGDGVIAEVVGAASATAEFLDRWRAPGEPLRRSSGRSASASTSTCPLAEQRRHGGAEGDRRRRRRPRPRHRHRPARPGGQGGDAARSAPGRRPSPTTSPAEVGNTGAAHWALVLADVLDRAEPGQTIAVVSLADGCDVWLLRTTDALAACRRGPTVRERIAATRDDLTYAQFLTWRGFLSASRRAGPSPSARRRRRRPRTDDWKFGFVGSRDDRRLRPPAAGAGEHGLGRDRPDGAGARWPTCRRRSPRSPSTAWPTASARPSSSAVIDFDGGGRFQCELTDVDPATRRDRRPRRDDVPPPLHQRRRPQLLLEGAAAGGRRTDDLKPWHRTASATRSPSSAWAARRSASTGTARPTTC